MSMPHATQQQIDEMNQIAAKKYGVKGEDSSEQATQNIHPMLAVHNEQPEEMVSEPAEDHQQEVYEDTQEEAQESAEDIEPAKIETSKEYNFRIMRERAERAERERDEMMRAIMAQQNPKQPAQQQKSEEEFDLALEDESLVEGKHLKELVREIKNLKNTVKNYEQKYSKTDQQTLEIRLQTQYPDFNQVVTHDNLVQLRAMNPDLADSILKNEDQYKQAKLAYEMVKQLGIYKGQEFEQDRMLAQKNAVKPRPLTSIAPTKSDSPLSKANAFAQTNLTKQVKSDLYQEMLQAMKGI